jgi:cytochrome c oxidase subunit II
MSDLGRALMDLSRHAKEPVSMLFPPAASAHAEGVDAFYMAMVGMSTLFSLLIALLILWFAIKYAKGKEADRTRPPNFNVPLEIAWSAIPLGLSVLIFIWGARLYLDLYASPSSGPGETVLIVGKQWMWKAQHPQGAREIDAVHVPMGSPIRLLMTSEDVIHSFFIPALRIKRDAVPGRYTSLWFQATRTGEFPIYCTEYCGTRHSQMLAKLVVMDPAAYGDWLNRESAGETAANRGEALFSAFGCAGCHAGNGTVRAPSLSGLFGKPVPLGSGGFALADEAYLRESIYFPLNKIVAGYDPVMPTFAGRINEEQMMELIAYIRSLERP